MNVTRVDQSRAHLTKNPDYYEGTVHFQELHQPVPETEGAEVAAVFFEPGARTRPHIHETTSQVLHVVYGRCLIVIENERRIVEAGNYAIVPPRTWHWHGAADGEAMCHVSIKLPGRPNWSVPLRDWGSG